MQEEIWKDVPGYEGLYQVSDLGRVRSLDRATMRSNGTILPSKGRIIKTPPTSAGYCSFSLHKDGKRVTGLVHQAVAEAFLGHTKQKHNLVIDHINGIKSDNRVCNLQLVSHRFNISKDMPRTTSDFTGVSWNKVCKKYEARIRVGKTRLHLGVFSNQEEASVAYQKALAELNKSYGFN